MTPIEPFQMNQPALPSPKLNLLALPSQTVVLFAIIVFVFLAAVLSGAIGPSPFCITPILLGVVLLPLRAYLAWPDKEIVRYALRPVDKTYATLQAEIAALSAQIGLYPPPCLLTTDRPIGIYTFGSLRRRYVAVDVVTAHKLMMDLATPDGVACARASLLHELFHFRNGDVGQMGYARELLRTVAVFLSWSAAFFIGMILLMMVSLPAVLRTDLSQVPGLDPNVRLQLEFLLRLDPASRAQVAQKASQINLGLVASFVLNSLLPMIIIGVVVWAFYWRKLLRVRELYADAGAAQTLHDAHPVQQAVVDYGIGLSFPAPPVLRSSLPWATPTPALDTPLAFGGEKGEALLRFHPRVGERIKCLQFPSSIFGSWWNIALVVGILVLLLDVLLVSPFTAYYLSSFPMHFATLSAFVAIAVSLLPGVAQGKPLGIDIARIVAVVMALRVGWLALNLMLLVGLYFISPTALADTFEVIVRSASRSAALTSGRVVQDTGQMLVAAATGQIAFQVVIGITLLVFLYADTWLKRRVFTWYGYQRIVWICWGITGLLALVLGTVVLLPFTALIMGEPRTLLNPVSLFLIVVAILTAGIATWLFIRADRRHGRLCPKCSANVHGSFDELGKHCPECGEVFHPWLIASY